MRYLMLGDDVIVGDDVLASLYLSWMARLGVEISTLKRYVSTVFATFAKRTYIRTSEGMVEFTGLSLSAVRGTEKSVGLLVSALRGERKKGIRLTKPMGEAVELLEQALGYPRGFRAVRVRKRLAQMTETVLDMVEGRVPVEECVSTLLDLSRLPNKLDELSAEERKLSSGRLVQQVCLQLFQEALSYSGDRGEGVGDYVIDLLFAFIKMTDRESRSPGGPEPFCLPNTRRGSLV
jgi:hypothetical protein